jgi:hypothetical protein
VAAGRWTELFRSLAPSARLATVGALAIPVSLLLPWYGVEFSGGLSKTGLDSFGFGQVALMITVGAVLYLIARSARGYRLPRPLRQGSLIAAGGIWAAVLVGYLMLDRPSVLEDSDIRLRYGIFVALGGAVAMFAGGLRLRREELAADRRTAASAHARD